jgi:hypothetical protein
MLPAKRKGKRKKAEGKRRRKIAEGKGQGERGDSKAFLDRPMKSN